MPAKKHRSLMLAILLLAVLLRVGVALLMGDQVVELPGIQDQIPYHALALRLLGGHGYSFDAGWYPFTPANTPTAQWSFAYPAYLAGVYLLFGVHPLAAQLIQAALVGIATCVLVYSLGRRVFGARAGLGAAGIADGSLQPACHPMLTPGREFWRLLFLERLWPRATYRMGRWDTVTPRRVEVIKGACLLRRREALDQVGPLDENYFMYTEEVDLCCRLARAGWELYYVPTAVVTHYGEGSSRQVKEAMYLQLYRSKIQFYRKFGGEGRARRAKALLALAYAPRWAAASLGARLRPAWRSRAHTYGRLLAALGAM